MSSNRNITEALTAQQKKEQNSLIGSLAGGGVTSFTLCIAGAIIATLAKPLIESQDICTDHSRYSFGMGMVVSFFSSLAGAFLVGAVANKLTATTNQNTAIPTEVITNQDNTHSVDLSPDDRRDSDKGYSISTSC